MQMVVLNSKRNLKTLLFSKGKEQGVGRKCESSNKTQKEKSKNR